MARTHHMSWYADWEVHARDGHRDEEAVLAALRAAGLLVRQATREEDLYGRTDCWVRYEGTVLGVDITTRVAGSPGWEAKRCADLMAGVVWLAIPQQMVDRGGLTPQAAREAMAHAVALARLAWEALRRGPRPYPGPGCPTADAASRPCPRRGPDAADASSTGRSLARREVGASAV